MSNNEELVIGAEFQDNGDLLLRLKSGDQAKRAVRHAGLMYAAQKLKRLHPLAAIDLMLMAEDLRSDGVNVQDDTSIHVLF